MLYFVIGLPGHFAAWCDAVALRLLRHAHGAGEVLAADTLGESAPTFSPRKYSPPPADSLDFVLRARARLDVGVSSVAERLRLCARAGCEGPRDRCGQDH